MIKKFSLLIGLFLMLVACSIERDPNTIAALGPDITQDCIEAGVDEQYPYGGCFIIFWNNGEIINTIFINNGAPGKDGINGINGINGQDGISATVNIVDVQPSEEYPWGGYWLTIGVGTDTRTVFISNGANGLDGLDGIDGEDGAKVTITTEEVEGGIIITITQGDTVTEVFVRDGADGTNGTDGIDGIDGQDGTNATITTEETEGGYNLYITVNGETTIVFISNGMDGTNGLNGTDGIDGIDGADGEDGVSATIRTEIVTPSEEHPYGGYNLYITVDGNTTVVFVSNGADGTNGLDGTNGQDGADGYSSSISVELYEGEYCDYGGYVITTSSTDPTVEDKSVYVCNCECEQSEDCDDDDDTKKVEICHKVAIGNDWNYFTLYLPQSAIQAHLDHGDSLGKCDED